MLNDVRYAVRFLARRRGFTLAAVLTVALGVGANTAIFSLADSVLFRPLPYAQPDRLFVLEPVVLSRGTPIGTMPVEDLEAARATGIFDALMDLGRVDAAFIREGDRLQPLRMQPVPPEYLTALGARPLYGRDFTGADEGERAVILTYRAWTARFGRNTAVLDTVLPTVDGAPLHVVGVLPPAFRIAQAGFPSAPPDMILLSPATYTPRTRAGRPLARLADGVTPQAAQARLSALTGKDLKPGSVELRMVPLRDMMGRTSSRTMTLLIAAAVLLLIVGCANLANLVLARGSERERELAVRASLGASRWRIARLLLVENMVVALAGGAAGLALAYWGFGVLVANLPGALARSLDPQFDARILLFGLAAAVAAGLVSGTLPAWRLARRDARTGLQLGGLQARSSRAGRKGLLSLEVAIAVVAVVAGVALARSLADLVTKELGFDSARLVLSWQTLGPAAAAQKAPARMAAFAPHLAAIRELPEVRSAAAMTILPAAGAAADMPLFPRGGGQGGVWMVSDAFFRTMGIPVIEGREIAASESFTGAPVGVINQSAARVLFPGGQAIGRTVTAPQQPARTIVGVVADWRQSFKRPAEPAMYVPFDGDQFRIAQAIVDAPDTPAVRERLRAAIVRTAPDSDVRVEPIDALLDREAAMLRFTLVVIGSFALLTLALAILGVYGVMAFIAGERTREYGVRVALGATRKAIGMLVVRQAVVPLAAGLAAGLVVAVWTSRLLVSQVADVIPAGAGVFTLAALALLGCGLAAAAIPARRATRVDPIIALRAE